MNQREKRNTSPKKQPEQKNITPQVIEIPAEKETNFDETIPSGSNKDDEQMAQILQLDTTKRKAKTTARKVESLTNIKLTPESEKMTPDNIKAGKRQCYGPGCVNASRLNSKYCSEQCGMNLARNRLLEILPQRIQQRKQQPCAADQMMKEELANIHQLMKSYQKQLEEQDVKIIQLVQLIHKSKTSPENAIIPSEIEDNSIDCKLCGVEISAKAYVKHIESCFKKQEKTLMVTGLTQDDGKWNIFCNHNMGRQGHCKRLRVLCPHHYRSSNDQNEVCGYPLEVTKFCGRTKKDCSLHSPMWEEFFRAEYDLEKLKILQKIYGLEKRATDIREVMAKRGNVIDLLLNKTVEH